MTTTSRALLQGLLICFGLLSASFVAARAILSPRPAALTAQPSPTAGGSQKIVELPFVSKLDLMALTDRQLLEARGALTLALRNQLVRYPVCFDGQDSLEGAVVARYSLVARDGVVQANLLEPATVVSKGHGAVSESIRTCLLAKIERRFTATLAGTRLTHEGDLGQKTFEMPVSGDKIGSCR